MKQCETMTAQISQLQNEHQSAKQETVNLAAELQHIQKQGDALFDEAGRLKEQNKHLSALQIEKQNELERNRTTQQQLEQTIEENHQRVATLVAEKLALEERCQQIDSRLVQVEAALATANLENQRLARELDEVVALTEKPESLTDDLDELDRKRNGSFSSGADSGIASPTNRTVISVSGMSAASGLESLLSSFIHVPLPQAPELQNYRVPRCALNHVMSIVSEKEFDVYGPLKEFACDWCGKTVTQFDQGAWHCKVCEIGNGYDVCFECAPNESSPKAGSSN
jgi:predicted  nucleic acid-binding Zn-ribbon protein